MIANAHLRWTETIEGDEPTGLEGTLHVQIENEDGSTLASLSTFVSGAPEALDDQLDRLLDHEGWERVGEVYSWPFTAASDTDPDTNAAGRCVVRRLELHADTVEAIPQNVNPIDLAAMAYQRRMAQARHAEDLEITESIATAILGTLRKHGLAPAADAFADGDFFGDLFVRFMADDVRQHHGFRHPVEYRLFLGMGVKFRAESTQRGWRVDCYPEERTPDLDARIAASNADLLTLEARLTGMPIVRTGGEAWDDK